MPSFAERIRARKFNSASSRAVDIGVHAETESRFSIEAGGKHLWGDGSTGNTFDVNLYRSAADLLKTDDAFQAAGVVTLTSDGPPTAALPDGALAVDTTNETLYVRANNAWVVASGGGGASVTVSDTAPLDPEQGDLWFESDTGDIYVYYSSTWVDIGGSSVANIAVTTTPPSSPVNGDLWFDTDTAKTYVYYNDGTSGQWVEIGAASAASAGTDGHIQFSTGGTFDSSANLKWDKANNELEIGGHIIPTTTETYDLGSSANRFRDLYLSGTSIILGAVTISTDGTGLAIDSGSGAADFATESYVDTAVSNVVDGAPSTLNTLNELAAAINDDPTFHTTVSNALANKQDSSTALTTATSFGGDVSGTYNAIVVADDSHNHIISNVDGLQTALDGKLGSSENAVSASKLVTARTISLTGDVSGSVSFDGSADVSITATVSDDSHNHVISNVDGLQTALDAKLASSAYTAADVLTKIKTVDGAGSGLDADTLDGVQGDNYALKTYVDTAISNLVDTAPSTLDTLNELAAALGDDPNFATAVTASIGTKLDSSAYTASDVLTKIKTVDGAGSGLDADTLDGIQGANFLRSDESDTMTGTLTATAFSGPLTGNVTGNASTATKLATSRTISLTGDVTGSASFDGSANASITATVADDSHNHIISNVDGLQTALDAKLDSSSYTASDVLNKVKTVDGSGSGLDADTVDGLQASVLTPAGSITMFAGSAAPTGWLLCEGQTVSRTTYAALFSVIGTTYGAGDGSTTFALPNLKGRVPVGRDSGDTSFDGLGEVGGAKTHTLTQNELPSHTHSFTGTSGTTSNNNVNHTHNSSTMSTEGSHFHSVETRGTLGGGGRRIYGDYQGGSGATHWNPNTWGTITGSAFANDAIAITVGGHTHTYTTSGISQNHTHTLTPSGTNSPTGGNLPHNNLQPYVVLNYIIKW